MFKVLGIFIVIAFGYVVTQGVVNRVFLINHRAYIVNVIQEVMNTVEERGWSNLRLPDFDYDINETIFTQTHIGTVTYKNGFLVSVQALDVLESSMNQIWNNTDGIARVNINGRLRMTDVTLGYDIEADFEDGKHHFTGTITHPLVVFDFWVVRVPSTHETWGTVFGNVQSFGNVIDILPHNPTSDALITLFFVGDTDAGVRTWAGTFYPILQDVIQHRVPFPEMCFNCPLTG